jgi:hypothetical protein
MYKILKCVDEMFCGFIYIYICVCVFLSSFSCFPLLFTLWMR